MKHRNHWLYATGLILVLSVSVIGLLYALRTQPADVVLPTLASFDTLQNEPAQSEQATEVAINPTVNDVTVEPTVPISTPDDALLATATPLEAAVVPATDDVVSEPAPSTTVPVTEVTSVPPASPTAVSQVSLPATSTSVPTLMTTTMNIQQPPTGSQENTVVIRFDPASTEEERNAYLASIGAEVESSEELARVDTFVVSANAADLPESDILAETEPDYFVSAQVDFNIPPNDPLYAEQWAIPDLGIPELWGALPDNEPTVTVAIIDSGICADHMDLEGRILPGYDFVENDTVPQDEMGHGCGVAGLLAATADNGLGIAGLAPHVQIMPLRVLDADGLGRYTDVAEAIIYAVDNNADVLNISLGGAYPSSVLEDAIEYARLAGVELVAAAGNTGGNILYPAAYDQVSAVGALNRDGSVASFSARGASVMMVPGVDIVTLSADGTQMVSGTSFAAPIYLGYSLLNGATLTPRDIDPEERDPNETPNITIDFDSWNVPDEFREPVLGEMVRAASVMSTYESYTVTAHRVYGENGEWAELALTPTYIVDERFNPGVIDLSAIRFVILQRDENGDYQAYAEDGDTFAAIAQSIPTDFLDLTTVNPQANLDFKFPWPGGQVWQTGTRNPQLHGTGGLTGNNAIDFFPTNTSHETIVASEAGTVRHWCSNDNVQQMILIDHADGSASGYLHLSTTGLAAWGARVNRGQTIGKLFRDADGGYFSTNCGWGDAPHVHFVYPTTSTVVDGYSANQVNSRGIGVNYTSTNFVEDQTPGLPIINSPANNSTVTSPVTVSVSPGRLNYTGQADYFFQIATNSSFSNVVWERTWTTTRTHSVPLSDGNYFIRVRQGDTVGQASGWRTHSFTVATNADLRAAINAPAQSVAGESVTFDATITNAGPSSSPGSSMTVTVGEGLTLTDASSQNCTVQAATATCNAGTMANGVSQTITFTASLAADRTTAATIQASVTGDRNDASTGNNTANATITPTIEVDVTVSDAQHQPATATDDVTVTVNATNNGPSVARDVTLTVETPQHFTIASHDAASATCETVNDDMTCTVASLAPGTALDLTVTYNTSPRAFSSTDVNVSVGTTDNDTDTANDTYSFVQAMADRSECAKADVNGTDAVDIADVRMVASVFNVAMGESGYDDYRDLNLDDVINIIDLRQVANQFGSTCTAQQP